VNDSSAWLAMSELGENLGRHDYGRGGQEDEHRAHQHHNDLRDPKLPQSPLPIRRRGLFALDQEKMLPHHKEG